MKRCSHCQQEKPLGLFYRLKGRPTSWCKACLDASNRANYERNRVARNQQIVRWRRAKALGMTRQEYEALPCDPGKVCAICGVQTGDPRNGAYSNGKKKANRKNLAIDHCHSTGRFRGFLCGACNQGLGLYADDPSLLRAAADYLERGLIV